MCEIQTAEPQLTKRFTIPVMIALLSRLHDQLNEDAATRHVAVKLCDAIEELFDLRELALLAMMDADMEDLQRAGRSPRTYN